MSKKILKMALEEAQKKELDKLPNEDELLKVQEISPRFEAKMNKLIKETKHKYISVIGLQIRRGTFIACMILAMLTTCMSVKAIRMPIIKFMIQVYEKFSSISFEGEEKETLPGKVEVFYEPQTIPSRYKLVSEDRMGTLYQLIYANDTGDEIIYEQFTLKTVNLNIDTENTSIEKVLVNGNEGIYYSNKNTNVIIWSDNQYAYQITGRIPRSQVESMALSVQIKK